MGYKVVSSSCWGKNKTIDILSDQILLYITFSEFESESACVVSYFGVWYRGGWPRAFVESERMRK